MDNLTHTLNQIDLFQQKLTHKRPLLPEELAQLRQYYNIGLAYSSNALEGNSLTETETKVVIEDGITIGGKPLRDHLEALGHQDAMTYMYEIVDKKIPFSEEVVCHLHRLFYRHIDANQAGVYRQVRVVVSGSTTTFPLPDQVPKAMLAWINTWEQSIADGHPVVMSAISHHQLVHIHPFVDGNGRTARLVMNLFLVQHGYPVAIIPPVLRVLYLDLLRQADQGEAEPFYLFIADRVLESQKDILRLLGLT